MSDSGDQSFVHVALLPSAGMGHLTPFLRLAALLTAHNVRVTFITPIPTVSLAESQSLSQLSTTFPQITQKHLHLLPLDELSANSEDPFYYHFELIRRSSHLLPPLLSSLSPPLSAMITDMSFSSTVIPITDSLGLPNYIFFTSSAKMLTLYVSFHTMLGPHREIKDGLEVSGLEPIPKAWIPPPLLKDGNNLLKSFFTENGKKMTESTGILINTFESIEHETVAALNEGRVLKGLPSAIAFGPLPPCNSETDHQLAWLDDQPTGSVFYVSFGSRTAMSREQVRELGEGLVRSGCRFLWVVKDKKVDMEDDEKLTEVLGQGLLERVKEKGLAVKKWLNQEQVLRHPAIAGFLSHCGWNSLSEALWNGVPVLAWPQHGDQKINADLVERIGLGVWVKSWGWSEEEMVVKAEDIAARVKEIMGNDSLRLQALHIKEEARLAVGDTGSSTKRLTALIETWKEFRVS
ncbi:putative UDP-glucuronosyl/UDP-glucosyltransferase [Rosa chinensis]|uniref:Glycosyltransferase n=1 Tax=Rosa chinensis TaxID=74649 RepID=A0A2P6S457_ROSCH|nr:UDP-glycosyltransferase 13 [Rosa chinensis]PRQ53456.1 putative UDP-glucuronosyl/UDP-glucosyltransferase [Rosa chinensis]